MEGIDWGAVIAALTGILLAIGGGLKLFNRYTTRLLAKAEEADALEHALVAKLQASVETLSAQVERYQTASEEWRDERQELCSRVDAQAGEISRLHNDLTALQESYKRDQERYEKDRASWAQEREELRDRISSLTDQVARMEEELERKTADLREMRTRLQDADIDRAAMEAKTDVYMTQNAALLKLVEQLSRIMDAAGPDGKKM